MKLTLTNIPLITTPDINQLVHLFWKKDGEPDGSYRTLPDATVHPSGVILSPSPYQFTTEGTIDTDIYVKAVNACDGAFILIKLFNGLEKCCADGATLSVDETVCYKTETTVATPPVSSENAVAKTNTDYSVCGSYIFDSFNINGTGIAGQIPLTNAWWRNGPGACVVPQFTNQGPMNRCAVWAVSEFPDQQVGFTVCITVAETKTYYMGVGCDNFAIIRVDGVTILSQDATAMDAQFGTPDDTAPLRVWCIYPITLTGGIAHTVELIGQNFSDPIPNPAALGAEIYNNTPAEIVAATSYAELDLVFSSKDYVGQPIQIGSGGIGYTCPLGFSLVLCDGPAYCTKTTETAPLGC
jgi:hypothetical protein